MKPPEQMTKRELVEQVIAEFFSGRTRPLFSERSLARLIVKALGHRDTLLKEKAKACRIQEELGEK